MRAISEMMKHEETRTTMERLADSYEDMADRRERQLLTKSHARRIMGRGA